MLISKQITVKEIQEEFSALFNGLKIEFYHSGHTSKVGSTNQDKIDADTSLHQIKPDIVSGDIVLNAKSTVAQFEEEMKSRFGLNVQVFRKSNGLYLQTITTDNWTLETQNTKGLNSTSK